MPIYDAGDASINVRPSAKNFRKELDAELRSIDAKLGVEIHPNIAQAKADIERWRMEEQAKRLNAHVDAKLAQAEAEMARFRTAQETRAINVPVHVDQERVSREITKAVDGARSKAMEQLRKGLVLDLKIAGVAGIPTLITGLAGVTSGIVELSQAALVLPGALAGAGSAVAALATGLSGVKEAFSAAAKAQDDSVESARSVVENQRAVAAAAREESRAQEDVARARRDALNEIRDLNLELKGSALSEADAILNLQQAQEDYAKGGFRTALEQQRAQLNILQANQRLEEVRNRNSELAQKAADANRKGVEGAPSVVAATDRLASAHDALSNAQARTVNSSETVRKAFEHLSPKAQAFITDMSAMREQFRQEFKFPVQDALFDGLSGKVKGFVATDLPLITKGFAGINTGINHNVGALLDSLKSAGGQSIITRILGNTAQAQELLTRAIDPLVKGVGTLAGAGSDALPRLSRAIGDAATKFDQFIEAADKDGRLAHWIDNGIHAASELGRVIHNIGSSLSGISRAFGGDFLGSIDRVTKRMAEFLNSSKGQADMRELFAEGRTELQKWEPILKSLGSILMSTFQAASAVTGAWLPLLRGISTVLAGHPGLATAVLTAIIGWKAIAPITRGVGDAIRGMSDFLAKVAEDAALAGDGVGNGLKKGTDAAKREVESLASYSTRLQAEAKAAGLGVVKASDVLQSYYANIRRDSESAGNAMESNMARGARAAENAAGNESKGLGKFAKAARSLSDNSGPLALLATAGILFVEQFVTKFNRGMDDAKNRTDALRQSTQQLIGTLDSVTNVAGLQTRSEIARQFQQGNQGVGNGIAGNALDAAKALGLGGANGQDLVTAALPGAPQYDQIMNPLRDKVRPAVDDFIKNQGLDLARLGIDEPTLVDAFLGVPSAVEKVQGIKDLGGTHNAIDLGVLQSQVEKRDDDTTKAAIVGQNLNKQALSSSGAVSQAQQAQAATVPQPHLRGEFANLFPGAVVNTDGTTTTILSTAPPSPGMHLGDATDAKQGVPPNQNQWTYRLSPEDARRLTYRTGGWTPSGKGTGPTGGWLAEVHDDEFILNKDAAAKFPAGWLHAVNSGGIDPSMLPRYKEGGEPGPDGFPIFQHLGSGVLPGPLPGADNDPSSLIPHRMFDPFGGNNGGPSMQSDPLGWMNTLPDGVNPEKIAYKAGNILLSGVLGFFGLDQSILSPSNPWNQAAQKTIGFYAGNMGPYTGANPTAGNLMQMYQSGNASGIAANASAFAYQGIPANILGGSASAVSSATPAGTGAERWRPVVAAIVSKYGPQMGIPQSAYGAWTDAITKQIGTESGGNPGADNPNDSNGQGGKQHVAGLLQYLPSSYASSGGKLTGLPYMDPVGQIAGALFAPRNADGTPDMTAPGGIGAGHGWGPQAYTPHFADGGTVTGPTGFDLIDAKLTAGETVVNRSASNRYGTAAMSAVNAGNALIIPNPPTPGMSGVQSGISGAPVSGGIRPFIPSPTPAAAPVPAPQSPGAAPQPPAQQPTAPQPTDTTSQGPAPAQGASAQPAVAPAPQSTDHELPALKQGISEGAAQIGELAAAALSSGGGIGGGAGAGAGMLAKGMATLGGKVANGVANVFSSALVGNLGDNTTAGAYGAPVLSAAPQPAHTVNQNTYFGDVSASDPTDFLEKQRLYEQQRSQSLVSYV